LPEHVFCTSSLRPRTQTSTLQDRVANNLPRAVLALESSNRVVPTTDRTVTLAAARVRHTRAVQGSRQLVSTCTQNHTQTFHTR